MTLDEQILAEAKEMRGHLVDLETQAAHARVDYHAAIKKLHAGGGSLREIAEVLELSHQRVHQIGEGEQQWIAGMPRPLTPRAKRVLERALNTAAETGSEQFGEKDIVLAMLEDPKGAGGQILRGLGVTLEQLRETPAR